MKQSTGSGGSFALGRSEPRGEGDLGALRAGSNAKPYDPEAPRHLDTGKRHAMLDGPILPTMVNSLCRPLSGSMDC